MDEIIKSQTSIFKINDFLNLSQKYTKEVFPDLNILELFSNSLTGKLDKVLDLNIIQKIFLTEFYTAASLMASILVIVIIHSVFRTIIENLSNLISSQIVYYVQYLIITTIIVNSFVSILSVTKDCINDIVSFMNLLIPLLVTLMLTTGAIATTSITQPIIIFMINYIGLFINNFLIPWLLVSIALSIVCNISDKIQLDKLSKFLKSSIVWILGIILTVFSCTLSIEGTLSSSVDGITAKTAKAAVSNFIPVVGKIMGDTVDSVIGCGNILKNSIGMIGVIIILGIIILPTIKILILWFSFKMTSAVCEVVADKKIVSLLDNMADSYKILLAILISVSFMFIIGITIVVKITNSVIMYR